LVNQPEEWKIGFKSLQDPVDTTSTGGMLICHIFCAVAEFKGKLIRERTKVSFGSG
jgi:DNA invertase Pin-like site-specific DNA recombinase